jgi:Family of unknown function (DUF5681)
MKDNATSDYRVGYGKPPKEHQFEPGRSGNPSGRGKGVRSFKSDLGQELQELICVNEGNTTVELTKQRAIIRTMVRMAIAGDPRATATIISSCARAFFDDDDDITDSPEDQAIIEAVESRPEQRGKRVAAAAPASNKKVLP